MSTSGFRAPLAMAFVVAALILAVQAATAQDVKITLGHHYPKNHIQGKAYEAWVDLVAKASNGRIKVTSHPAGSLINAQESLNAVSTGSVQASNMIGGFQTGTIPFNNIISLPFMFQDREHFRRALDAGLFDMINKEYEKHGVLLLNYFSKGATFVFHKKKFMITPADYKGANLRGLGGYLTLLLDELGANAVTLPTGEVTTALQRGVVDGLMTSCTAHVARGWAEEAKYVSDVDLAESGEGLGINRKFFDSLPADLRKAVADSAREMAEIEWDLTLEADAQTCPELWKKHNLPNRKTTAAEREALREAAGALYAKAEKEIPGTKEVLALVEKTRK